MSNDIVIEHAENETFNPGSEKSRRLREEIILCCKANSIAHKMPIPLDNVYLALLFRTEEELTRIAKSLHIKVD